MVVKSKVQQLCAGQSRKSLASGCAHPGLPHCPIPKAILTFVVLAHQGDNLIYHLHFTMLHFIFQVDSWKFKALIIVYSIRFSLVKETEFPGSIK